MPKKYQKKKSTKAGPNPTGPKYRTPSRLSPKVSMFSGPSPKASKTGFTPSSFKKTQHRG